MSMFNRFRAPAFATLTLVVLLSPSLSQAQNARETLDDRLRYEGESSVTRGTFLRDAVKILGIDYNASVTAPLPYPRVPAALNPYVAAAHRENALGAFGQSLLLARPITRGEAARVVVELLDAKSMDAVSFRDINRGTTYDKAVRVVIEHDWMEPKSNAVFGIDDAITGDEAEDLLINAALQMGKNTTSLQSDKEGKPTIRVRLNSSNGSQADAGLPKRQLMETVWSLLNSDYLYDDDIDQEEAAYSAIEAIVDSVDDPYTKFLRPVSAQNFQTQIKGSVSGIGAQVEDVGGFVMVVTPLKGSPAEAAGIRPGDKIIAVDGESIVDLEFMEAVNKIRGPKGSVAELTVRRDAGEVKIRVERDDIQVPEIDIRWHDDVPVVQLMQFGRLTESTLRTKLEALALDNPQGIVLDLRNNPGGLLNAANVVLSNFLPQGSEVAVIKSRNDQRTDRTHLPPTIPMDVPMIVIVNAGSASASEIVAGALRDHGRATVIGEKTFGKGTVQEVVQFTDQSNIKITIAEWFTPGGHRINENGIEPDLTVSQETERDMQLLKALDLLR